jgi:hypothetical protein
VVYSATGLLVLLRWGQLDKYRFGGRSEEIVSLKCLWYIPMKTHVSVGSAHLGLGEKVRTGDLHLGTGGNGSQVKHEPPTER